MKKWTDTVMKKLGVEEKKAFKGRAHKLGGAEVSTSSQQGTTASSGKVQPPPAQPRREAASRPSRTEELVHTSILSIGDAECESAMRHIVGDEKDNGAACLRTVHTILSNIIAKPEDDKVRTLRLQNPKIQSCIVDVHGGMELLLGCGFEVVFETDEDGSEHGYLVLPRMKTDEEGSDSSMDVLGRVVKAIGIVLGLPQRDAPPRPSAAAASLDECDSGVDRNTIMELPTSVDTRVPDWFFAQSSAEIKQLYRENREKLEQSKVLMTRAMREKLHRRHTGGRLHNAILRIRVRAPEGTKIVGDFGRGEPVQALFAWVSDCLVDPMLEFDLIMPDRRKLGDARFELKTLAQLGLAESQTLNLAWIGDSVHQMKNTPAFRENL